MKFASIRSVAAGAAMLACAFVANAGSVTFNVNTNTGSDDMEYEIVVDDNTAGLFTFAVSVANSSPNNGDVCALYFDMFDADAEVGYSGANFYGAAVTNVEFNTQNAQGGNIGQEFQFAISIGETGSGNDFYDSFTFSMDVLNGLTLSDFALFAVRGQSVGPNSTPQNPGDGSSKTFVRVGDPPVIPLPTGAALAGVGLGIAAFRRRR